MDKSKTILNVDLKMNSQAILNKVLLSQVILGLGRKWLWIMQIYSRLYISHAIFLAHHASILWSLFFAVDFISCNICKLNQYLKLFSCLI